MTKNASDFQTKAQEFLAQDPSVNILTDGSENLPQSIKTNKADRIVFGRNQLDLAVAFRNKSKENKTQIFKLIGQLDNPKLKIRLFREFRSMDDNNKFISKYGKVIGLEECCL